MADGGNMSSKHEGGAGRGGGGAARACLHWGQISNKKPVIVIASQQPPAAAATSITLSNNTTPSFLPYTIASPVIYARCEWCSVIWYFIIWRNRMELFYLLYGAMTPTELQESCVQYGVWWRVVQCAVYIWLRSVLIL